MEELEKIKNDSSYLSLVPSDLLKMSTRFLEPQCSYSEMDLFQHWEDRQRRRKEIGLSARIYIATRPSLRRGLIIGENVIKIDDVRDRIAFFTIEVGEIKHAITMTYAWYKYAKPYTSRLDNFLKDIEQGKNSILLWNTVITLRHGLFSYTVQDNQIEVEDGEFVASGEASKKMIEWFYWIRSQVPPGYVLETSDRAAYARLKNQRAMPNITDDLSENI